MDALRDILRGEMRRWDGGAGSKPAGEKRIRPVMGERGAAREG